MSKRLTGNRILPSGGGQRLSETFRSWEKRGRGTLVFDYPVELEPPYERFSFRQELHRAVDDARIPHLFARLLPGRQTSGANEGLLPAEAALRYPPPLAPERRAEVPLAIFRVDLPPELKIAAEQTEQLLLNLAHSALFAGYEILGLKDTIALQICCPAEQSNAVLAQLAAHLPSVGFRQANDLVAESFDPSHGENSVTVDFGLGGEWFLPLPLSKQFAADALLPLVAALSEIQAGEAACFQIIFGRTRAAWQQTLLEIITGKDGKCHPAFQQPFPQIKEKLSRPLLAVCLRFAAQGASCEEAWHIARRAGAFIRQFSTANANTLVPLRNDEVDARRHLESFLNRTSFRTGMLLSSAELAAIARLPSDAVKSAKLQRDANRTKAAPQLAAGHALVLGENTHHGQTVKVSLSTKQRTRHTFIIGASGSGKSTLLKSNIQQNLARHEGLAAVDPHGDLIDDIIPHIPENRIQDVILFDAADSEFPIGFNILHAHGETEKILLASDMVAVFRRLATSWGDVMDAVLANAVLAIIESQRGGTLLDLKRFLVEKDFRQDFLRTVKDEAVRYFWEQEFPHLPGRPQASILIRLDAFLRQRLIRNIVCQKESWLNLRQIMDERKILLIKLSQGLVGTENAELLGTLLIAKLYQIALSRQDVDAVSRPPFWCYIDEAASFINPSLALILSSTRKYGLGLTLAAQNFKQFLTRDADLAAGILSNCYTRICFRLGDEDARRFAEGFSFFTAEHLQNLGIGEAVCRVERAEYDFNLKTFPVPPVPHEIAEKRRQEIIAFSRERYAVPKAEVEAQMQALRIGQAARANENTLRPAPAAGEAPAIVSAETQAGSFSQVPTGKKQGKKDEKKFGATTPSPPLDVPSSPVGKDEGRGGQQHRYLQSLVKRLAESRGYLVTIEQPVLGGAGSVDAALEKNGEKHFAVEISVTSAARYEMQNLRKCLTAGFEKAVLIVAEKRKIPVFTEEIAAAFSPEEQKRITLLAPEDFPAYLEKENESAEDESPGGIQQVKGRRVKVNLKPLAVGEEKHRAGAIAKVLGESLKRLKPRDE